MAEKTNGKSESSGKTGKSNSGSGGGSGSNGKDTSSNSGWNFSRQQTGRSRGSYGGKKA